MDRRGQLRRAGMPSRQECPNMRISAAMQEVRLQYLLPKGSKKDWQTAIVALAAVVGFVILLIMMVR